MGDPCRFYASPGKFAVAINLEYYSRGTSVGIEGASPHIFYSVGRMVDTWRFSASPGKCAVLINLEEYHRVAPSALWGQPTCILRSGADDGPVAFFCQSRKTCTLHKFIGGHSSIKLTWVREILIFADP